MEQPKAGAGSDAKSLLEQAAARTKAANVASGTANAEPIPPKPNLEVDKVVTSKKEEVELVEVTQFMAENGVRYFAKEAKSPNDMTFPHVKKMVKKGSEEDK